MKVCKIPLNKIDQNENSRTVYRQEDTTDLMASMRRHGILQPVGVAKSKNGRYEAIFGNRRILAANKLDWDEIDAHVYDSITDIERDILNLTENLKRKNTSPAEDGRMFCLLRDRGLTVNEICVRLDLTKERVQTAMDSFENVPTEYRSQIINSVGGRKPEGKISAATTHQICNLKKSFGLNRPAVRSLMEFAKTGESSAAHIRMLAPLVKDGMAIQNAISVVEQYKLVEVRVYMDRSRIENLEAKHGKSISTLLGEYLEESKEFKARMKPTQAERYKPLKSARQPECTKAR